MDPVYIFSSCLRDKDYLGALNKYSELLQRFIQSFYVLSKGKDDYDIMNLIQGGDTNAHAIIINTLVSLIKRSSNPSFSMKYPPLESSELACYHTVYTAMKSDHADFLFVPPNFNKLFNKILTLSVNDIRKPGMDGISEWREIYDHILNKYPRFNNNNNNEMFWFRQLELIVELYRALMMKKKDGENRNCEDCSKYRDDLKIQREKVAELQQRFVDDLNQGEQYELALKEIESLKNEMTLIKRQNDTLRVNQHSHNNQREKSDLQKTIREKDEELRNMGNEIARLENERETTHAKFKNQIGSMQNEIQRILQENNELKNKITFDQGHYEQTFNRGAEELNTQATQLQKLISENKQMKSDLTEIQDEMAKTAKREKQVGLELNSTTNSLHQSRDQLAKLRTELKEQKEKSYDIQSELRWQLDFKQKKNDQLTQRYSVLANNTDLETEIKSKVNKIEKLQQEIESVKAEKNKIESQLDNMEKSHKKFINENKEMETELNEKHKMEIEENVKKMQRQKEDNDAINYRFRLQITEKNDEIQKLKEINEQNDRSWQWKYKELESKYENIPDRRSSTTKNKKKKKKKKKNTQACRDKRGMCKDDDDDDDDDE